ncbi:MAG: isochorismatase family protein [Bacteroidia bacterium]|nr:isochorismatase family protein [Bacteroidia bacterium]
MKSILITQCLQNDFVAPIGKFDPLPNSLHIGYKEALRLIGENSEHGPVNTLIKWAYNSANDTLKIIHIRDWHDANDPEQKEHLRQFGLHCLKNTGGAEFVFEKFRNTSSDSVTVNASGLNDFFNTELEKTLSVFKNEKIKVGITGVWTEAKISFLAYELKTRYPNFDISVCSALTASSSTSMHFIALDQLKNILGVKVFESIGDFTNFLSGTLPELPLEVHSRISSSKFIFDHDTLIESDKKLLSYLFREAKEASFKVLDGGFSGNVVMKASAIDLHGHKQVPTVIKIGKRSLISKERASFERIQEILGNSAPAIVDFAEDLERGAIKYRYAAMLDEKVTSFQKLYESGTELEKVFKTLDIVFEKQLGRLYKAARLEKLDLLKYYDFNPKYASSVRKKVEALTGKPAVENELDLHGKKIFNVCNFYEKEIDNLGEYIPQEHYMSYVHGDLNGANIMIDAQENVWMIDFFHTHYGHVLRDLVKLENDLLFIFMKINSEKEFLEATEMAELVLSLEDLGELPGNEKTKFGNPAIQRAFDTLKKLRSFYPPLIHIDKIPYQYYIAMLRYSMHSLSFNECNDWQKKLALYCGSICCKKASHHLKNSKKLRINYITSSEKKLAGSGLMGLTILPGRKDRGRNIEEDLATLKAEGIKNIVCLLSENEFADYGVAELKEQYTKNGFSTYYLKILDQSVCTKPEMENALNWVFENSGKEEKTLVHCVGGLGRSGMLAACFHKKYSGLNAEEAIGLVRSCRGQRAIESISQEEFVSKF